MLFRSNQRTNVVTETTKASPEPGLEVVDGSQLEMGEEVVTTSINPVCGDDGTREETLSVPNELVDYFIDDLLGEMWCDHFGGGKELEGGESTGDTRRGLKAFISDVAR